MLNVTSRVVRVRAVSRTYGTEQEQMDLLGGREVGVGVRTADSVIVGYTAKKARNGTRLTGLGARYFLSRDPCSEVEALRRKLCRGLYINCIKIKTVTGKFIALPVACREGFQAVLDDDA